MSFEQRPVVDSYDPHLRLLLCLSLTAVGVYFWRKAVLWMNVVSVFQQTWFT